MRLPLRWLLLTAVACGSFSVAGTWQYQRGVAKQAFLDDFAAALKAPAVDLEVALSTPAVVPRPVSGELSRVAEIPWLLLDNVRRGSQVGLRAIAAYRSPASVPVLVDFGWIAMPPNRQLPILDVPPSQLSASGLLVPMPGQGLRLGANDWSLASNSPVLLTYLDLDELSAATGVSAYAGLLRLDPELPYGYTRDLDALPNTLPAEKHFGYAVQWFGFALATLVIYLIFLYRAMRR